MAREKLTENQRHLLEHLEGGARIVHAQDGDRAWLSPSSQFSPFWDDIDWDDMAVLRGAGYIADLDDGDDESRFAPPEVITDAGRQALAEEAGK